MNYSAEWDQIYGHGLHDSLWPWSDVVRLVYRHVRRPKQDLRVLELGFGAGANIPFFSAIGTVYHGVEGSAVAVERVQRRFPDLVDRLVARDFTRNLGFAGPFDLIVDRSALTHNSTASIRQSLTLVRNALSREGVFLGVDWFSTEYSEMTAGGATEDPYTRQGFAAGALAGTGVAHFADEAHMRDLFSDFAIELLEHKMSAMIVPAVDYKYAAFNVVARRQAASSSA